MGPDWCFYDPWRGLWLTLRNRWHDRHHWNRPGEG